MRIAPVLALAALLAATTPAHAQFPPDSLMNLQVLPQDMAVRDLIDTMRGLTVALGVRCAYCHIGAEGDPLSEFDFVSDDMPAKRKAREMLKMVAAINGEWLPALPRRAAPAVDVQCVTCHRGQARPILLEDLLVRVADSADADAAVIRYRDLRTRHYGGFTYDFGPAPVAAAAADRLRRGKAGDALALLALNGEFHPDDIPSSLLAAQAHVAEGDTAAALATLESAARVEPANPQVRRLLERLKGGR